MLKYTLALTLVFVTFGCSTSYEEPESPAPKPSTEPPVVAHPKPATPATEFRTAVRALPEPNKYVVDLSWSSETPSHLYIQRSGGEKGLLRIEAKQHPGNNFEDESVEPGVTYEYLLCIKKEGNVEVLGRQSVVTPKDLVVSKYADFEAGRNTPLNRLFFTEGAIIDFEGRRQKIYADELIGNDAIDRKSVV